MPVNMNNRLELVRDYDPKRDQAYGLNHKDTKRKLTRKSRSAERLRMGQRGANRADQMVMALEVAIRSAKKREEERAMHGPVRVLWKDGKKVQDNQ